MYYQGRYIRAVQNVQNEIQTHQKLLRFYFIAQLILSPGLLKRFATLFK